MRLQYYNFKHYCSRAALFVAISHNYPRYPSETAEGRLFKENQTTQAVVYSIFIKKYAPMSDAFHETNGAFKGRKKTVGVFWICGREERPNGTRNKWRDGFVSGSFIGWLKGARCALYQMYWFFFSTACLQETEIDMDYDWFIKNRMNTFTRPWSVSETWCS